MQCTEIHCSIKLARITVSFATFCSDFSVFGFGKSSESGTILPTLLISTSLIELCASTCGENQRPCKPMIGWSGYLRSTLNKIKVFCWLLFNLHMFHHTELLLLQTMWFKVICPMKVISSGIFFFCLTMKWTFPVPPAHYLSFVISPPDRLL